MTSILFVLIRFLQPIMHFAADFCESFMSHFGLLRWASNRSAFTYYDKVTVGGKIFYTRFGKPYVRSRPSHFNLKDPRAWKSRWSKLSAYFNCARCMNYDLSSLFQGKEFGRSWFNTLCSQLSHFWMKQNDGAFLFSPGVLDLSIGNGNMPDARRVVFTSTSVNELRISFDNNLQFPVVENNDDTLQLMFIDQWGQYSFWIDLTAVTRSSGSATYIIPESFGAKIYPSIKFKSGALHAGMFKGTFRFPKGMQPVKILR